MNDETRKLFDAPWTARECPHVFAVNDASGELKAETLSAVGANRLARMPELYDALMEAVMEKCRDCLHAAYCSGELRYSDSFELIEDGCPFKSSLEKCKAIHWLELLRKVRAGK